ncbi:aldolase/citrate lyase family protein [Candidatus Pelagibacter sp.]|nr:aldolase/citrate lyase family protein [Candidatus Pelagibacter sp.]
MSRSFLFVPSTFEKYLLKIDKTEADKIVLDLEDSIDQDDLNVAYTLIKKHRKILTKQKVFARVPKEIFNYKTIKFLILNGIRGFVIPKIHNTNELKKIINIVNKIKIKIELILLAETAFSIVNLNNLLKLSNKFYGIMFGHEDYSLDIKIFESKNKNKFVYVREKIIAVANSNNLVPIDSPFLSVNNKKGFKNYIKDSKEKGFKGVICLSPTQCEIANQLYLPDEQSYKLSKKIIKISKENKLKKKIIYHNSIFVGPPIIKQSKLIIESYEKYKKREK